MELFVNALISTVFCLWILGTIGVTMNTWTDKDRIPDSLRQLTYLTPNWNFFAPHPGQWDYHLLYRDRHSDGTVTHWTETTELTDTPKRYKWFWNPHLYQTKALFDMGQELTKEIVDVEGFDEDDLEIEADDSGDGEQQQTPDEMETVQSEDHILTTQYLLLLNYVSKKDHGGAAETQFMLMRSSLRDNEPAPLFISNFHKL